VVHYQIFCITLQCTNITDRQTDRQHHANSQSYCIQQ